MMLIRFRVDLSEHLRGNRLFDGAVRRFYSDGLLQTLRVTHFLTDVYDIRIYQVAVWQACALSSRTGCTFLGIKHL